MNGRRLEANEANPSLKLGLSGPPFASGLCPISPLSEGVPFENRPIRFKKFVVWLQPGSHLVFQMRTQNEVGKTIWEISVAVESYES